MVQLLGWLAAGILVSTIGAQVFKQWRDDTSKGVSVWLFLGEMTANALFVTYASLKGDLIFIVANSMFFATACAGLALKLWHKSGKGEEG